MRKSGGISRPVSPSEKLERYAIQGRAARFIDRIEGSWSNVVGLPLASVHLLLMEVTNRV
jgi:septum formation protein